MPKPGVVNIRGREYSTVALRVSQFREKHAAWSLETEILQRDTDCVVMKATIKDEGGRILASGHAEEYRNASTINETSALENCETSAIGRALAALGLGGTEFASADELTNALQQQNRRIPANHAAGEALDTTQKRLVEETVTKVIEALAEGKDFDAYALCESLTDEMLEEKLYLWSRLDSKQRSRIKKQADAAKKPARLAEQG
jgi:hypothetical protein